MSHRICPSSENACRHHVLNRLCFFLPLHSLWLFPSYLTISPMHLPRFLEGKSTCSETHDYSCWYNTFSISRKPFHCYEPLRENQIRLLVLHPGSREAPICCSLQTVNLFDYDDITARSSDGKYKTYDAISYVWRTPKVKQKIYCKNTYSPCSYGLN